MFTRRTAYTINAIIASTLVPFSVRAWRVNAVLIVSSNSASRLRYASLHGEGSPLCLADIEGLPEALAMSLCIQ